MCKMTLFLVALLPALYLPMVAPVAAETTCSGNLAYCQNGVASRGQPDTACKAAFAQCMKTGVWQTYGQYGRRVEGVVRK
jgi:hypothetical protein